MLSKLSKFKSAVRNMNERAAGKKPKTREELLYNVDLAIYSCRTIIDWIGYVSEDEFLEDEKLSSATAMHMIIVGNCMDAIPDELMRETKYLSDLYRFRCVVAHSYGSPIFEKANLWNVVSNDLQYILGDLLYIKKCLEN